MRIVNFGSLNIDYVYRVDEFLRPGETKPARSREIFCGGKGLNQSIACARAGLSTYHAGFIGTEGLFLKEKLAESGVATGFIREVKRTCGHAIIQVSDSGQNCILLYPGTNALLTEAFADEVLSHFVCGDVALFQNETNLVPELIEKASRKGLKVALNAAPFTEAVKAFPLELVDWLFVNEIEGASLSGEKAPEKIAARLRALYPNTEIILTLGAEGCLYTGGEGVFSEPAADVIPLDTTAAGDTFTGFYLMAALNGEGAKRALQIASAASGLAITRMGAADSIPTIGQVQAVL
ncbi:Bifunctional ribokinase/ribose-5-phosphate isomerase A [bioreactor metagenome]|uniref:Bifunctional ribokinase/ribose-5-phosphate isomerase A n=1 Tax=bioreactor metagenome TaxID=1076179 RepID=A0A644WED9_9ZZZZ